MMHLENWSEEDLEELDAKFDALTEYFGLEFVFEKISDGSDSADRSTLKVRRKNGLRPDYTFYDEASPVNWDKITKPPKRGKPRTTDL